MVRVILRTNDPLQSMNGLAVMPPVVTEVHHSEIPVVTVHSPPNRIVGPRLAPEPVLLSTRSSSQLLKNGPLPTGGWYDDGVHTPTFLLYSTLHM